MRITNETIIKAQQGDLEALNQYIELYSKIAYRYSLQLLHNRQDAEDCTQEAMAKVCQALHSYDPKSKNINAWTYEIIKNHVINYNLMRDRMRSTFIKEEDIIDETPDVGIEVDNETKMMLSELERKLGPTKYTILVYKIIYNFDFKEIGDILNMSYANVRQIYSRAVRESKNHLRGYNGKKL